MQALIGQKKSQSQKFLENGTRIPVTLIDVKDNCVIAVKTSERDHYQAIQLGFSMRKNANKALMGHAKGAKRDMAPKFLKEVRILDESENLPEVGSILNPSDVFAPGDIVNVSGISKGKGFAGVVKRHGFHGGPKTHGQSDRHRAPGAIGQGTTPGRVYRGKRMAGRMGNENVTVRNLEIMDITADGVLIIKGLVPGIINGPIMIKKVGEGKKFVPLWREAEETPAEVDTKSSEEKVEEPQTEEAPKDEASSENSMAKQVEEATEKSSETPLEAKSEESENVKEKASEQSSEEPEAKVEEVKDAK